MARKAGLAPIHSWLPDAPQPGAGAGFFGNVLPVFLLNTPRSILHHAVS